MCVRNIAHEKVNYYEGGEAIANFYQIDKLQIKNAFAIKEKQLGRE